MTKISDNLLKNAVFAAAFFGLFFVSFISAKAQNTAAKLSAEQWQADVKFLGDELPKRHRNAFHRLKQADYEAAVKQLYDRVPQMTEDEIIVGLMKIVALIKDGHTNIIARPYFRSGLYPVRFYMFSDGIFIRKAAPEYSEIVGAKVLRIGNMSAEEAFKAVGQVAFADNEMGTKAMTPLWMTVPEILAGLKVIDDKQKLSLTIETGGKQKSVEIKASGNLETLFPPPADWIDAAPQTNPA